MTTTRPWTETFQGDDSWDILAAFQDDSLTTRSRMMTLRDDNNGEQQTTE